MVPHLDGGEIADVEHTTFNELYSLYVGMQKRFEEGAKIPREKLEEHDEQQQLRDIFGSAKLDDDDGSGDGGGEEKIPTAKSTNFSSSLASL